MQLLYAPPTDDRTKNLAPLLKGFGVLAYDSFDRSNAPALGVADTGQRWEYNTAVRFGVVGNVAQLITASGATNTAVIESNFADCTISARFTTNTDITRLAFRYTDGNNMFFVQSNPGTGKYELLRVIAGSQTSLGSVPAQLSPGDVVTVQLMDTTINVSIQTINGIVFMTAESVFNRTATKHGIGIRNLPSQSIDNFKVEKLAKTVVYDSFNRPDSPTNMGAADTGQVWNPMNGTWGVVSGLAARSTTSATSTKQMLTVVESGLADCEVTVVNKTVSTENRLAFRCVDPDNHYHVKVQPGKYELRKVVGGTMTSLGNYTYTAVDGDIINVVLNGQSITVFINDVQAMTVNDSSFLTATKHGLGTYGNVTLERYDNFKVEAL